MQNEAIAGCIMLTPTITNFPTKHQINGRRNVFLAQLSFLFVIFFFFFYFFRNIFKIQFLCQRTFVSHINIFSYYIHRTSLRLCLLLTNELCLRAYTSRDHPVKPEIFRWDKRLWSAQLMSPMTQTYSSTHDCYRLIKEILNKKYISGVARKSKNGVLLLHF